EPQLLDVDRGLGAKQRHFGLAACHLRLTHIDQRRLTDAVARLRELQKLIVALDGATGEVRRRYRLQYREVLLFDSGDQDVFRTGEVSIGRAELRLREPILRRDSAGELIAEREIVKGRDCRDRLREALSQERL